MLLKSSWQKGVKNRRETDLQPPTSIQKEGSRYSRCKSEVEQAVPLKPTGTLWSRSLRTAMEKPIVQWWMWIQEAIALRAYTGADPEPQPM